MRNFAWSVGFAIMGATLALGGGSGCTVTINGDDGGLDFDSGTEPETSTTTPDTGTTTDSSTPVEAGCGTEVMTGVSAACDTCINTSCCSQLDTCATPDSSGVDDSGASGCLQYSQCVLDLIAADGGDTMATARPICAPTYTTSQQAQGNALLDCIQTTCAASCM